MGRRMLPAVFHAVHHRESLADRLSPLRRHPAEQKLINSSWQNEVSQSKHAKRLNQHQN